MIMLLGFVEESNPVANPLSRQHDEDVFLVCRSNPEAIQLQIESEQKLQVFQRKERACFELFSHYRVKFFRQPILDALDAARLGLNKSLKFIILDSVQQSAVDVQRKGQTLAIGSPGFGKNDRFISFEAIVGAENDI